MGKVAANNSAATFFCYSHVVPSALTVPAQKLHVPFFHVRFPHAKHDSLSLVI